MIPQTLNEFLIGVDRSIQYNHCITSSILNSNAIKKLLRMPNILRRHDLI